MKESWYNPQPKDAPVRLPRRVPKRIVPSFIGEINQVLNLLMYRGAGGIVKDYSGNDNDGEFQGNPQWSDKDIASWALSFDGVGDWLKVPDSPDFTMDAGFTLLGWIVLNAVEDEWECIVGNGGPWQDVGYSLTHSIAGNDYKLRFETCYEAGTSYSVDSTTSLDATDTPYFCGGVYDDEVDEMRVFVDGERENTLSQSLGTIDSPSDVGIAWGPWPDYGGGYLNARVYMVFIYSRALPDSGVKSMYEATKPLYVG